MKKTWKFIKVIKIIIFVCLFVELLMWPSRIYGVPCVGAVLTYSVEYNMKDIKRQLINIIILYTK